MSIFTLANKQKERKQKNGGDKINNTHKVNDVKTPKSIPCSTSVSFGVVPGFISFHIDSTLSLFPIQSDAAGSSSLSFFCEVSRDGSF